jgi:hypothetical protein
MMYGTGGVGGDKFGGLGSDDDHTVVRMPRGDDRHDLRHEGHLILEELKRKHLDRAALAKACGVSWTAAKKYVESEQLGAKAWETCRDGLLKLGINPDRIRPPRGAVVAEPEEDLKPELQKFKDEGQLHALRRMLAAPEDARRSLIDAIDGALLWRAK